MHSYRCRYETKIIRKIHCVTVGHGQAKYLKAALAHVPDDAVLSDVECDDEPVAQYVLIFTEEIEDKAEKAGGEPFEGA